jgi:hypothetical protein
MKVWIYLLCVASASAGCSLLSPHEADRPKAVTSVEQALELVQQYEHRLYERIYGKDKPLPPLASREKPHSVIEKSYGSDEYYVFEFRKPFRPNGGGYVKGFGVNKRTGKVGKTDWRLGR